MEKIKQIFLIGSISFLFWGLMYPEFSLLEETYEYIGIDLQEKKEPETDFFAILKTDGRDIDIKFKLFSK
ncbi:MAG: hypothetical protein ACRC7V_00655 [Lachnospiraceae bacterium]